MGSISHIWICSILKSIGRKKSHTTSLTRSLTQDESCCLRDIFVLSPWQSLRNCKRHQGQLHETSGARTLAFTLNYFNITTNPGWSSLSYSYLRSAILIFTLNAIFPLHFVISLLALIHANLRKDAFYLLSLSLKQKAGFCPGLLPSWLYPSEIVSTLHSRQLYCTLRKFYFIRNSTDSTSSMTAPLRKIIRLFPFDWIGNENICQEVKYYHTSL